VWTSAQIGAAFNKFQNCSSQ